MKAVGAASLSVVVPVFNEKSTILEVVHRILTQDLVFELIVVDDGSTDGTWELLTQVQDDRLVLLRHEVNLGKGAALRTGFSACSGDIVAIQDADLEYDPRELKLLISPIVNGQADVVFGSRFSSRHSRRVLYFWHSMGNRLLTFAANALTNLNLTDMETGYKAFTREVLDSLTVEEDGFGFEPEFTIKVASRGFRIYEVGVSYHGRSYSEGKKIVWSDGVAALRCLAHYSVRERRREGRSAKISAKPMTSSLEASLDELSDANNYYSWIATLMGRALTGRVLELGAGSGTFTRHIAERATSVDAIEPSAPQFEKLRSLSAECPHVNAFHGTLEKAHELNLGPFDNAVLVNVLEHIRDDRQTLRELRTLVRPGGSIAVWVPAYEALYSRFDREVGHFKRYSRKELKALALNAGLEIERLSYVNALGAVAWGLVATLGRQRPTEGHLARLWDRRVVPVISAAERRVTVPWGQSVLLVARVPGKTARPRS